MVVSKHILKFPDTFPVQQWNLVIRIMLDGFGKSGCCLTPEAKDKRQYVTKGFHLALSGLGWPPLVASHHAVRKPAATEGTCERADVPSCQPSFQLPLLNAKRTRDKLSLLCPALFSIYFCILCKKKKSEGNRRHCGKGFHLFRKIE